jgi:hypothetical protein
VGEDPGARGGTERGQLAGDLAAAPHHDERDEVGQPDQRLRACVAGRGDELHGSGRHAVALEGRRDHELDEGTGRAERG